MFLKSVMFWLYFEGELEAAVGELADSNCQLATLKAESDAAKGAVFPVLNFGNKHVDRVRDKQKDLQDMESTLKELMVLCCLLSP